MDLVEQVSQQQWRADDGKTILPGNTLAERLFGFGLTDDEEDAYEALSRLCVGMVVKTGVSAWERIV